jgi:primary-amine oxidase
MSSPAAPHPLDPLTAEEIRRAAAAVRVHAGLDDRWRFASIMLLEPAKEKLDQGPPARLAEVVCWSREDGQAHKAIVSLEQERVISWRALARAQPPITPDEWHEVDRTLRAHPEVVAALARRGITELDLVLIDVWAYGGALIPDRHRDRRIGWCDVWVRASEKGNPYAHPVFGLHPIVDLNAMTLLELGDQGSHPFAPVMGEYIPELVPGLSPRADLRPLEIRQPDGASFTLEGRQLRWQRWSMRIGFNQREGLVLHCVSYEDGGRTRSIANRLSLAEMVVPYRDPSPEHARRTAFDIGEWGLGLMTTSLRLGCDCLGEITYLDAVLADSRGEPFLIERAICIHEEDDGVLWKHVDERAGAESRRSRRLVVSFHATVANYEYLIYWRFYQDGSIQCEVRASGIMITTPFAGAPSPHGVLVDESTYSPYHQHFLIARLDLDIDGRRNTVYACDAQPLPVGPENPDGLALVQRETPLRSEREGRQDYDWGCQRTWKIANSEQLNRLGSPVAYKLLPGGAIPALMPPDSPVLRRARALEHTLWVTAYSPEERWPCGEFPNQSLADDGLPVWIERDRAIADSDVVLWYVFGINHVPRVEEWPVMPVDTVCFWLRPAGFFDRNPALDVPPDHCR